MTNSNRAFGATVSVARATVDAHLEQLLNATFAGPLSIARIADLMTGAPLDFARLGNLSPVVEGQLLEEAITLLASVNPRRTVLVRCRLPLFGSEARSRSSHYTPDLVLIDHSTGIAHIVDIKRSLNSYESHRIQHLKQRMLSGAARLDDVLRDAGVEWDVQEVRVAVVSVDAARVDPDRGVLSLQHLDELLDVPDAACKICMLRQEFQRRTKAQFAAALELIVERRVRERQGQGRPDRVSNRCRRGSKQVVVRLARLT